MLTYVLRREFWRLKKDKIRIVQKDCYQEYQGQSPHTVINVLSCQP